MTNESSLSRLTSPEAILGDRSGERLVGVRS